MVVRSLGPAATAATAIAATLPPSLPHLLMESWLPKMKKV